MSLKIRQLSHYPIGISHTVLLRHRMQQLLGRVSLTANVDFTLTTLSLSWFRDIVDNTVGENLNISTESACASCHQQGM